MSIARLVSDGLQSLTTRLGTSGDKAATASYAVTLLNDQQLEAAFRSSWVAKKIVTIPAQDATRKWRQWSGPQAEIIEELEDARGISLKTKVAEAYWKARLFGGSAILIGTDDADWSKPLVPGRIKKGGLRYLAVLTRHDLMAGLVEDDPRQPRFGRPRDYTITTMAPGLHGMLSLHPSRLVEFFGDPLPRWNTGGQAYGWGDSVLQAAYEACRNLDSTMANIASLVFDAKTDVIKIPGLTSNITSPDFEQALLTRFSLARMLKGNNGMLILDAEEEYDSKSYSFSGLDAIADRFMQVVSGAADVPMTRLLGMSPGGLNSTGDGDLANYYDKIASIQSTEIEGALVILDEVVCRSAGASWEEHTYEWRPLRQMTEGQISEIRARDAQTIATLAGTQVFADETISEIGRQLLSESGIDVEIELAPEEVEEEWDFSGDFEEGGEGTPPGPFDDAVASQPRWPKGVPVGGRWMGPEGAEALAAYEGVLKNLSTKKYPVSKLKGVVEKAKANPKSLSHYEGKKLNAIKKGLIAEHAKMKAAAAPAVSGGQSKAGVSASSQGAKADLIEKSGGYVKENVYKKVATKQYPKEKLQTLLVKAKNSPEQLTQYEGKKLNAMKKAAQEELAKFKIKPPAPAPAATQQKTPAVVSAKKSSAAEKASAVLGSGLYGPVVEKVATKQYPKEKLQALLQKAKNDPKSLTAYEGKKLNALKTTAESFKNTPTTTASAPVPKALKAHELGEVKYGQAHHNAGAQKLANPKIPSKNQEKHLAGKDVVLTTYERMAVNDYTGSGYSSINDGLRQGKAPTSKAMQLDSALAKSVLSEEITVTRGFAPPAMKAFADSGKLAPGSVISDKGFLSTSGSISTASSFAKGGYVGVIRVKPGQKALPVSKVNGKSLSSMGSGENEWILPRGAGLKIIGIDVENRVMELEML